MCVFLAVALCGLIAVVNAQFMFPLNQKALQKHHNHHANSTSSVVHVKKCTSTKKQCWEQTSGEPQVVIKKYEVTSKKFPCADGDSSATQLTWDTTVQMQDGTCDVTCSGFGCENGNVKVCADFGFPQCAPVPAGKDIVSKGPSKECQSGLGSYTITITCPDFEFVTYLSY